jgi:nicotinamidase-related amidase
VDFQQDIMGADGAFAAMFHAEVARTKLIQLTARLLEAARRAGVRVVYSRAAFQAGYTDLVANLPLFSRIAEMGCLIDGTAGTAVLDEVAPHKGDLVSTRNRVSAFHGTELDVVLRGAGIDTVILAGVATNLAVESSARAAADLGYRVLIVEDACSTISQTVHDASLTSLAMLAEIVLGEALLAAFAGRLQRPPDLEEKPNAR